MCGGEDDRAGPGYRTLGGRCNVGTFVAIAKNESVGEVVKTRLAAMFAAYNVIELERKAGIVFVDQTVFTAVTGSKRNRCPELFIDVTGHGQEAGGPWLSPSS